MHTCRLQQPIYWILICSQGMLYDTFIFSAIQCLLSNQFRILGLLKKICNFFFFIFANKRIIVFSSLCICVQFDNSTQPFNLVQLYVQAFEEEAHLEVAINILILGNYKQCMLTLKVLRSGIQRHPLTHLGLIVLGLNIQKFEILK